MFDSEQASYTGDQPPVRTRTEHTGFNVDAVELVQVGFNEIPVSEQVYPLQPGVWCFAVRVFVSFA